MDSNTIETIPLSQFVSQTLSQNLSAIQAEVDGVLEHTDIEFIHRIRIAIRRYRNNLNNFIHFVNQDYSDLMQCAFESTNEFSILLAFARDLDIQKLLIQQSIDTPVSDGKAILLNTISLNRLAIQKQLEDYFKSTAYGFFLQQLASFQSLAQTGSQSFVDHTGPLNAVNCTVASSLSYLYPITAYSNNNTIHQFRKSIRKVRYTLECFQDLFNFQTLHMIDKSHQIQDILGDIHDLDMLADSINQSDEIQKWDKETMHHIIKDKREPLYQIFLESVQNGEIKDFLHQILNHFDYQIKSSSGKNTHENRITR